MTKSVCDAYMRVVAVSIAVGLEKSKERKVMILAGLISSVSRAYEAIHTLNESASRTQMTAATLQH